MVTKRIYMTDAAARIIATRDELPKRISNQAMLEDAMERIEVCDRGHAAVLRLSSHERLPHFGLVHFQSSVPHRIQHGEALHALG
jgi:hypothetical protein